MEEMTCPTDQGRLGESERCPLSEPVEEGLAFVGVGVGKDHRVEVVCRQRQRPNDAEPVAWDALHGPQLLRLLCPCVARQ